MKNGQLKKGRELLHSVTLKAALEKLCHLNDLQTLINQMNHSGLAEQFRMSFWGASDFMQVVRNYSQFDTKSKILTKLNVNTNLSGLILKDDITRQELEEKESD